MKGRTKRSVLSSKIDEDAILLPAFKNRRLSRSMTAQIYGDHRRELLESVTGPVLSSGFMRWYEAKDLGLVSKGCQAAWKDQRDTFEDWSVLLQELNQINRTNCCRGCQRAMVPNRNRRFFGSVEKWTVESAKRKSTYQGIVDILLSSGFLTVKDKCRLRGVNSISLNLQRNSCTCSQRGITTPYVESDPRFSSDYDDLNDYEKCYALHTYTKRLISNLHSFYNFKKVTDPVRLPPGLDNLAWVEYQLITLQRCCPGRYALIMNVVSLYVAQYELQQSSPTWYASAFMGNFHRPSEVDGFEEFLGNRISEFCLPATDEILIQFLRKRCYPQAESQAILGPLISSLSVFAPIMDMVPLDASRRVRMPRNLEQLSSEHLENMSLQFFCTIS